MEYVIFAAALLGILILLFLKGLYDYRQEQKRFRKRLHTDYGKKLEREYRPEWFTHICRYSDKHAGEFPIDEITWCDLNMDEVFKQMNYTYSSAGEEYLYYLLRNPQLEETYLVHMEEVIRYAQEHHLMISLETHNPDNVPMYEHFGFKLFGIVQKHFDLKQYCLIREIQ